MGVRRKHSKGNKFIWHSDGKAPAGKSKARQGSKLGSKALGYFTIFHKNNAF